MSTLVGVGVGPGDPELVTVKAADLLAAADVVFVPVAGPAEQIVLYYAEAWRVEQVVLAGERAWDAAAVQVAAWFAAHPDGTAAFATTGDPAGDATFGHLAGSVRDLLGDLTVELIPGVTAGPNPATPIMPPLRIRRGGSL